MQCQSATDDDKINIIDQITVFKCAEYLPSSSTSQKLDHSLGVNFVDEDGDLSPPRRRSIKHTLIIEHSSYTDLDSVGLQVWNGALVMSDFILHKKEIFAKKYVLEFGSGTGLVGIMTGKFCEKIVCTDVDNVNILNTIRKNFENNKACVKAKYDILPLDFSQDWSDEIKNIIEETNIYLASELIYDNNISQHLINLLVKIFSRKKSISCYISVEKRFIFTVENQRTEAIYYDYFFKTLKNKFQDAFISYKLIEITDIPEHFFEYERDKKTELWCVTSCF